MKDHSLMREAIEKRFFCWKKIIQKKDEKILKKKDPQFSSLFSNKKWFLGTDSMRRNRWFHDYIEFVVTIVTSTVEAFYGRKLD